jgi:glyoxylase-like metal-dependent hydrolase (beta-lactamase superfamily II)
MAFLHTSSLQYPWPDTPQPGTALAVAPGVRWLSMPLPFQLDHINLWLLEDDGGWTIVDCGIGNKETRELWERIFSAVKDVKRVILTHYHPDHAGNAGWLCKRFGVQMWTTQGEYLTAHAVRSSGAGYTSEAVLSVFNRNGLDPQRSRAMASMRGNNRYAELVPDFPHSYRRIIEGDRIRIGGREWLAIVGHGHAPEHLSLFSEELNTVIAGDMLLSTISTNVSVWSIDPRATRCACSSNRWRATVICPKTCWCCPRTASRSAARMPGWGSWKSITRTALPSCSPSWPNRRARMTCCRCCFAARWMRTRRFSPWARP